MKNEKDIALLDNYFNGLLSASEAAVVQQRAVVDPDFGAEYALREQMQAWLHREPGRKAVSETLQEMGDTYFKETPAIQHLHAGKINWQRRALLAAGMVLLFAALWFFARPKPSLYAQYAHPNPPAFTVRGANDADQTAAETAFNKKDYETALAALERMLAAQPNDVRPTLYKGICLLELNRPAQARLTLEPLANGNSALRADAIWYIALSYTLENNYAQCRSTLSKLAPGDEHYDEAQHLMADIKELGY